MTTRRSFLEVVASGVGVAVAGQRLGFAGDGKKPPLGLQLYSLREELARTFPGPCRRSAAGASSRSNPPASTAGPQRSSRRS